MIVYSVLLFTFAALLLIVGTVILVGFPELLYDARLPLVKNKPGYAIRNGLAMILSSLPLIAAGILLIVDPYRVYLAFIGLGVLLLGMFIFYPIFRRIQRKHDGGMF